MPHSYFLFASPIYAHAGQVSVLLLEAPSARRLAPPQAPRRAPPRVPRRVRAQVPRQERAEGEAEAAAPIWEGIPLA